MGNPRWDWGLPEYPSTTPGKKSVRTEKTSGKPDDKSMALAVLLTAGPLALFAGLVTYIAYGNYVQ